SQLFRISSYIKNYLPSLKTEKITHENHSSWKEKLNFLINIKISFLSKEEETTAHTQNLEQINNQDILIIYTDGSKNEKSKVLEAGLAFKTGLNSFQTKSFNLEKNLEVF